MVRQKLLSELFLKVINSKFLKKPKSSKFDYKM